MPRVTVDLEALLIPLIGGEISAQITLDGDDLPPPTVLPAVDVDLGGPDGPAYPVVLLSPGVGRMISNGAPGLGWEWTVFLTVLAHGYDEASALADHLYRAVHGLHDRGAAVAGVGEVSSVEDLAMPARTASVLVDAQNVTQFDATFTVRVRPPRA